MTLKAPMRIRARMPEDIPLVTDAWLRSYAGSVLARELDSEVYRHHEHALIQRLWRDPGVTWLMAAPPDAGTFAYGFLCGEATDAGPVLHYIYVKRDDRRLGIGGELLTTFLEGQPRDRAFYTHRTRDGEALLRSRFAPSEVLYDPYLAWEAPWR